MILEYRLVLAGTREPAAQFGTLPLAVSHAFERSALAALSFVQESHPPESARRFKKGVVGEGCFNTVQ